MSWTEITWRQYCWDKLSDPCDLTGGEEALITVYRPVPQGFGHLRATDFEP